MHCTTCCGNCSATLCRFRHVLFISLHPPLHCTTLHSLHCTHCTHCTAPTAPITLRLLHCASCTAPTVHTAPTSLQLPFTWTETGVSLRRCRCGHQNVRAAVAANADHYTMPSLAIGLPALTPRTHHHALTTHTATHTTTHHSHRHSPLTPPLTPPLAPPLAPPLTTHTATHTSCRYPWGMGGSPLGPQQLKRMLSELSHSAACRDTPRGTRRQGDRGAMRVRQ